MSKNNNKENMNDIYGDEEINLIDLKPADEEVEENTSHKEEDEIEMDFAKLKFIENPVEEMSSSRLPQTLSGCVGYMDGLPLLAPNADQSNPQTIVDMINSVAASDESVVAARVPKKTLHSDAFGPFGHTVRTGCISFYKKFETIYAAAEGRWLLLGPLVGWMNKGKNVSLDQDVIRVNDDQVLIIRIIEGNVGLITIQGVHHLLDVGTHVFNSGTVKYFGAKNLANNNYMSHGPYHYVNVPRGKNAKVWALVESDGKNALVPRLIKEGEHFVRSTFFKFEGMANISDEYIGHDSIHILNVVKGSVAKANCDNEPRLFGEGLHIIESPNFSYIGRELISMDNLCIAHGTITILQVPRGKIALLWKSNQPCLIERPGLYEFNSNDVFFKEFVDSSARYIELGAKKVILVYTGEVGITYDKGHLQILENGHHVIDSSTHIFERFLSTKQRSIRLITYNANHKIGKTQKQTQKERAKYEIGGKKVNHETEDQAHKNTFDDDSDLLVCETKDLVKVGVRADVFYSIVDPEKCIQTLNTDELEDLVRETAVSTLTNIIRSTGLNQIAQSRQISASESELVAEAAIVDGEGEAGDVSAVSYFFDRAHDEFMNKLHEDFVSRYGVDIANIRLESFKIMDTELANEIAQNCLTTAHVENQLSNLQGQNLIATQKEQTAADCEKIKALSEATALQTRSDAENARGVEAAKAEAEAQRCRTIIQAQAEADAILCKAKAEAEALRLKAAAEAERATLLSQTRLGQQEALFQIYADMVKSSNEGVDKVVYLDPSINKDSTFALGSLDGLNRDLHALSKLGMVAETMDSRTDTALDMP
ncbi:unnamed protein product [Cylindrotheca closterium]|uniref:Band 7 domain-containing protein n=1 Tax=Cylindrotheca closterium TaxID=2856 RepID=A0AAD2G8K4_9STRA|nr:unnamed protein product [Cylindrotheca closterium]